MTALRLYTDGSCPAPGAVGGWAWILVSEHPVASGSGKTRDPSTHQRCELTAAIEGLTYLVASGVREVELLSDSRYVVGGMSSTGAGRAVTQVATMERLALGQSTDHVAGHDGGPLSPDVERMDEAELTAYLTGRMEERGLTERAAEQQWDGQHAQGDVLRPSHTG
jgi:ribonuclease HI